MRAGDLLSRESGGQFARFCVVGLSSYAINLGTYWLALRIGVEYHLAAVITFAVALVNGFLWNRRWTFRAHQGRAGFQAARFLVVSLAAFAFALGVLHLLVALAGLHKLAGQAVAALSGTPINFVGNKLWSFKQPAPVRLAPASRSA